MTEIILADKIQCECGSWLKRINKNHLVSWYHTYYADKVTKCECGFYVKNDDFADHQLNFYHSNYKKKLKLLFLTRAEYSEQIDIPLPKEVKNIVIDYLDTHNGFFLSSETKQIINTAIDKRFNNLDKNIKAPYLHAYIRCVSYELIDKITKDLWFDIFHKGFRSFPSNLYKTEQARQIIEYLRVEIFKKSVEKITSKPFYL